jgi:DNA-binding response OmpR family regulator
MDTVDGSIHVSRCGHVIVVDDDESLREMLIRFLEDHHVPTKSASNKSELNRHLAGAPPRLIILDLQLGHDDGFDLLKEIRHRSDVPVIIVTGNRPDEIDRIVGLELGADDYMVKPFSPRELLARARAVLRGRELGRAALASGSEHGGYRFNGWTLERRGRKLFGPDAVPISLTKGEYNLLLAFLGSPRRTLTREHLMHVTRRHEDIFDRSIDVQVLRLRRKLKVDPGAPKFIQAERGIGYVFLPSVEFF